MRVDVQAWGGGFGNLSDQLWAMMDKMEGGRIFRSRSPHCWQPRLNVYETPVAYLVCAELAGMPREDIEISAVDGVLHLRGARERPAMPLGDEDQGPSADKPVSVALMEIDSGRFHRKLAMPPDADLERSSATYRHGYLWIRVPRA